MAENKSIQVNLRWLFHVALAGVIPNALLVVLVFCKLNHATMNFDFPFKEMKGASMIVKGHTVRSDIDMLHKSSTFTSSTRANIKGQGENYCNVNISKKKYIYIYTHLYSYRI